MKKNNDELNVGIAQIAPVWLDREKTLEKILTYASQAGDQQCQLVVFGDTLLPGYPFWIERTDGAKFNSRVQKEIHAHYANSPFDQVFVAVHEQIVVGFISCHLTTMFHEAGNTGRITSLVVTQHTRHLGVGSRLIQKANEYFKANNCSNAEFTSQDHRREAHLFYQKLGYKPGSRIFKNQNL